MLIGDYRLEIVPDAEIRLDGGAMFGVVPRVLWERLSPPDEMNRIRMYLNCVFIEAGPERILIETGIGEKWADKETRMYGISRQKSFAESLHDITGCKTEDITMVINTHLHFDHAGGNTINRKNDGYFDKIRPAAPTHLSQKSASDTTNKSLENEAIPQFPNARYLVSKRELEHAENPSERDRASYLPENWRPMLESGQLEPQPDDYEPVPGLKLQTVSGHSETMQIWKLCRNGAIVSGFADLVPTRHHIPPAWIAGYDLFPLETLRFKKEVLPLAAAEQWICHLYHDPDLPLCRLAESNGKITATNLEIPSKCCSPA